MEVRPRSRASALRLAPALLPLLAGCANPGPPRPPSLHLPALVTTLRAERVDNRVLLSWMTPAETTDGGSPKLPLTAVLCRQPAGATACRPVQRFAVTPGTSRVEDTLPADLERPPLRLLSYRVELQNAVGRSAGFSAASFTAAGPAPAPAGAIAATATRDGALITWQPAASPGVMQLTRTLLATPTPAKPVPDTILTAPPAQDPGGLLDRALREPRFSNQPVRYVAQRVQSTELGGHSIELRGAPSPPVAFTYRAIFPPDVVTGLTSIPSIAPPAIDLSWEVSGQPGVAGYNIYRSEGTAKPARLNPAPIPAPAFRDLTATPGRIYMYRVTAVDTHGNESVLSDPVQDSVPKP